MVFPVQWLMQVPCVVDHTDPGPVDEYGDHPPATLTTTNERCWLAQTLRGEEESVVETERWNLYLPPEVVVDANDVVHIAGDAYQVLGNPWRVVDPLTTWPTHIEATVIRRI
jgi:hypothetical protein